MPRYHFNVFYDGAPSPVDAEGIELAGDDAAWSEATESCGQMITDLDGSFRPDTDWRMEVTDADGALLYRLQFRAERTKLRPKT